VWNINHVLNDKEGLGKFLKALFGYNGNPELIELVAYVTYLLGSLTFFLMPQSAKKSAA
jgi:high-affinity iron transporter